FFKAPSPPYIYTLSLHDALPILFRTDILKKIMCEALYEARRSASMLIFAYVIMLDHYHIITDGKREPSDTLRYLNGISAKRILRSEEHTSELQSRFDLVCRLLLE